MLRYLLFLLVLVSVSACSFVHDVSTNVSGEKAVLSYKKDLDPDTKLEFAKKRKNYMSGIRKGDYYSLRNNPDEALSYYLQVEAKLPDDQVVRKKIAHVYYLEKNWKSAYENYTQVPFTELTDAEQTEMFQSLFFDDSQIDRIGELQKIPTSTGSREYFRIVDTCYSTIHDCIVGLTNYSGSSDTLHALQSIMTGAELISPDFQYRNLVVAAQFYEQGMYGVSARMTDEMLKARPDYLEAMKIAGFSLYELGKYAEAKPLLLQYLEKNPTDLEVTVRMGEIYVHLGDIVSSNLYLNNAILGGYTPKTDIERRLAYNYSLLGDNPSVMKVMNYLLQEEDVKEDDYAVAISYALEQGDLIHARTWSEEGIRKYPHSPMLVPLYIEALRLAGDTTNAQIALEGADASEMEKNPNFLLQKAIFLFEQGRYEDAKSIFSHLSDQEEWPGVSDEAKSYLTSIETQLASSGALSH